MNWAVQGTAEKFVCHCLYATDLEHERYVICEICVTDGSKYSGVIVNDTRNCFTTKKEEMLKKQENWQI